MQDIKKREIEYVRYRAVALHSGGAESKALLEAMRSSARAVLSEFESGADLNDLPWPPSSASGGSQEFLRNANECSLWATKLQGRQEEARTLRKKFSKLLDDLPERCGLQFGEDTLGSERGRAQLVLGLVKKRTGELVELDLKHSGWQLRAVDPSFDSASLLRGTGTQWLCREGGVPAVRNDFQFGYPAGVVHIRRSMACQVRDMVGRHGIGAPDLNAHWRFQIFRARAPCRWTHDFEWHRTGLVVSLGELMQALGKQFSAKEVHLFYRSLRIVALKRQKGSKSQGLLGARQSLTARRGRTKRILQSA